MRVRRLRKFVKPRTGELITFESKQYYVTDIGDVYDGDKHRYVAQYEDRGYLALNLRDDNGTRHTNIGVHRLIASVFLRLLKQGEDCHHISHDRKDNRLENLEIISASEHSRQHNFEKWRNGTYDGLKNVGSSYRPARQVAQLSLDGRLVNVWPSTMECGRNGYNQGKVSECCNGKHKTHKGFRWQWYVKEKEK